MLVSVIVPVYGVELFVGRCVRSLLAQTWQDLEIVIVDDCSKDKSIEVVESVIAEYPGRNVRILHHEQNKGLPAARNTGIEASHGEYLLHFDGDDYADPDMLARMVEKAIETGADIVYSDWYLTYENSRRYMPQPDCKTAKEALTAMLEGRMKYNVWNKLVRRSLYEENAIRFPSGYGMGEDMTMIRLTAVAKSVAYLPEAYYNYVKSNTESMTASMSEKTLMQIKHNVEETLDFLKIHIKDYDRLGCVFKLIVKYPMLFNNDVEQYKMWNSTFIEANKYVNDRSFGRHAHLVQLLAKKKCYVGLKLHNMLYALIYRLMYCRK